MLPPPPRRKQTTPPPRRKAAEAEVRPSSPPLTQEEADAFFAISPAILESLRAWNNWDADRLEEARLRNPKKKPKRKRRNQVSALTVVRPFSIPLPTWNSHTKARMVEQMLAEEEKRRNEELGLDG